MQKGKKIIDCAVLDIAIVQCLRIFARHGRQIRIEQKSLVGTQKKRAQDKVSEKVLEHPPLK
jgi:hypothetical protein